MNKTFPLKQAIALAMAASTFAANATNWYVVRKNGSAPASFHSMTGTAGSPSYTEESGKNHFVDAHRTMEGEGAGNFRAAPPDADVAVVAERGAGNGFFGLENAGGTYDPVNDGQQGHHYIRLEDFAVTTTTSISNSYYLVLRKEAGATGEMFAGWSLNDDHYARDLELSPNYYAKLSVELGIVTNTQHVVKMYYNGNQPGSPSHAGFSLNKSVPRSNVARFAVLEFGVHQLQSTAKVTCRYYELATLPEVFDLDPDNAIGITSEVTVSGGSVTLKPFISCFTADGNSNDDDVGLYAIGIP